MSSGVHLLQGKPVTQSGASYVVVVGGVRSFSHVQLFAAPWTAPVRFPCPSPSPGVWANSCPLNQWHHSTNSSSVVPFSSYFQSVPAPKSFLISKLFASGSQSIGASTSALVLHMTIQSWFPLGLISLQSKGLLRLFSSTTVQKHQFFGNLPSLWSDSHIRTWLLEKPQLWLYGLWQQSDVSAF